MYLHRDRYRALKLCLFSSGSRFAPPHQNSQARQPSCVWWLQKRFKLIGQELRRIRNPAAHTTAVGCGPRFETADRTFSSVASAVSLSLARKSYTPLLEHRQNDTQRLDYVSNGSNTDTCRGFADVLAGCLQGEYKAGNPTQR